MSLRVRKRQRKDIKEIVIHVFLYNYSIKLKNFMNKEVKYLY